MPAIELVPPLTDTIARYRFDALGYVNFAFPWGQAGTSLADESGPEPWQRDVLEKLGQGLMAPDEAVRKKSAQQIDDQDDRIERHRDDVHDEARYGHESPRNNGKGAKIYLRQRLGPASRSCQHRRRAAMKQPWRNGC